MDARCVQVRVARHDIGLLCSLMAGYEGVAIVRTQDASQGLVELLVAPAFYQTLRDILQGLSADISLCLLEEDDGTHAESPRVSREPPVPDTEGY